MLENLPIEVTLVGPAFIPTGRGEEIRCVMRALDAAGANVSIRDVSWWRNANDEGMEKEIGDRLVGKPSSHFNIFVINGNEIDWVLKHIGWGRGPQDGYNIVLPQWELGIYPREWAEQLNRFDEVWAPSRFVFDCLRAAAARPVFQLTMPVQIGLRSFLGRKYFGLPENSFLFMFLFDFGSYVDRKNPFAVIRAFRRVCAKLPYADTRLVLKISGHDSGPPARRDLDRLIGEVLGGPDPDKIIILDRVLTDNEIKNLIRCSDCFVSLHRSEGFGRGLAEAMFLGKPVVATGYSGNLDFMNGDNSCLVRYNLIAVGKDEYLFPDHQVWADPDIEQAERLMTTLLEDTDTCLRIGYSGSRYIRTHFSNSAVGLQYVDRLKSILAAT